MTRRLPSGRLGRPTVIRTPGHRRAAAWAQGLYRGLRVDVFEERVGRRTWLHVEIVGHGAAETVTQEVPPPIYLEVAMWIIGLAVERSAAWVSLARLGLERPTLRLGAPWRPRQLAAGPGGAL
jgi:hypothetical protein